MNDWYVKKFQTWLPPSREAAAVACSKCRSKLGEGARMKIREAFVYHFQFPAANTRAVGKPGARDVGLKLSDSLTTVLVPACYLLTY